MDSAIAQLFDTSLDGDHVLTIGLIGSIGGWQRMDRRFTRTVRKLTYIASENSLGFLGQFRARHP